MKYILAIDEGTSSTRAILYNLSGQIIAKSQQPLTQFYPENGWVEHCPEEIWSKTLLAIQAVASSVEPKQIIGCGITNQRETTLIWNKKTGQCLHRAIVWQDRRTDKYCQSLSHYKQLIHKKTGLFPDPYFSASKLHWLMNNISQAHSLAERNELAFGTVDSFLLWRLTKGKSHCTDVTNASRTLLFNIHTLHWDEELLDIFDIPMSLLPNVYASDAQFGIIDKEFLGSSIPITGIAGDQHAALIGQRCFDAGMIKGTFGTGGFMLMNTGHEAIMSNYNLLTTVAFSVKNEITYGLEGSLYHAGTTVNWLREEMNLISTPSETETLAQSLHDNEGVYFVPSFTGMGAPHWISSPGAIITGLSRKSNRAHFARAALESVCYQTRDVLDCMSLDSGVAALILRIDGGMTVNNWFLQFLASQCDLIVQRPADVETTAEGVAILAAIGCGEVASLSATKASWVCEREFLPLKNPEQRAQEYQGWLRALRMASVS